MNRAERRKRTEQIRRRREALLPRYAREDPRISGRCRHDHEIVSQYWGNDLFDMHWTERHVSKSLGIEELPGYRETEFPGPIDESEMCNGECSMCHPMDDFRDILEAYDQYIIQGIKDGRYDHLKPLRKEDQ